MLCLRGEEDKRACHQGDGCGCGMICQPASSLSLAGLIKGEGIMSKSELHPEVGGCTVLGVGTVCSVSGRDAWSMVQITV